MTAKVKIKILYIPEGQPEKYPSEELWYEQTASEGWLEQNNPEYFRKVIAAFNGVQWSKEK